MSSPRPGTFAARLEQLIADRPNPLTDQPYSGAEIADAVGLSKAAMSNLRRGETRNPSWETIGSLARFFSVDPNYFFGSPLSSAGETVENWLRAALADSGASAILAFSLGLSDSSQTVVLDLLTQLRALEGHPVPGPTSCLTTRQRWMQVAQDWSNQGTLGSAILIEIDEWALLRDTLGSEPGDWIIAAVTGRLADLAHRHTGLLTRQRAAEFTIALPPGVEPETVARDAHQHLASPIDVHGIGIRVSARIGAAIADTNVSVEELLHRADLAMRQVHGGQRASVALYDGVAAVGGHGSSRRLAGELRRAVNGAEFEVRFQPIVDLHRGIVVAVEALPRWRHPSHGVLEPSEWRPLLEKSDVLMQFVDHSLRTTLEAARRWHDAGFELAVALDVPPRCLLSNRLAGMLDAALRKSGVDAAMLALVLAEPATPNGLPQVDQTLEELHAIGVRLMLDSFGTGRASLNLVQRTRAEGLRIDRASVEAMSTSRGAAVVVRAAIELARDLSLIVTADGVDTAERRQQLTDLGCHIGQGSLFGEPMSAADLLRRLADQGLRATPA